VEATKQKEGQRKRKNLSPRNMKARHSVSTASMIGYNKNNTSTAREEDIKIPKQYFNLNNEKQ
jgi:hypothetical protein